MKCAACKRDKPKSDFGWRNRALGKLQFYCKSCVLKIQRRHYRNSEHRRIVVKANRDKRRKLLQDYANKILVERKCIDCGNGDIVVLGFYYKQRPSVSNSLELKNISSYIRAVMRDKFVKEEIEKCDVRCANCQKRKEHKDALVAQVVVQDSCKIEVGDSSSSESTSFASVA